MVVRVNRIPDLLPRERQLLDFAKRQYRYPGKQEQDIRDELDMSATTFWRKVNDLIDRPEALAYDPVTVNRLRRLRETRQRARSRRAQDAG